MHHAAWTLTVLVVAGNGAAADRQPGFDSPGEAFHAYVTGMVTEDYELMLSALTPKSRAYHVGLAVFSAVYLFGDDPEMQKLLREHGVDVSPSSEPDDEPPGDDEPRKEQAGEDKSLVEFVRRVNRPAELMKKIFDRHRELAKLLAEAEDQPDGNPAEPENDRNGAEPPTDEAIVSSITLENLEIAGKRATASLKLSPPVKQSDTGLPETVHFRRIKGRWYCHIDPR